MTMTTRKAPDPWEAVKEMLSGYEADIYQGVHGDDPQDPIRVDRQEIADRVRAVIKAEEDALDVLEAIYREADGGWTREHPTAKKAREVLRRAGRIK